MSSPGFESACNLSGAQNSNDFVPDSVAGGSFEVTLRNSTKQQLPGNNENR